MASATKPIRSFDLHRTAWHMGRAWIGSRIFRKKYPLLMSWNLTFRCNLRCHYCASPSLRVPEKKTDEIIAAIDHFYELGTRWITFSGGEPLLRKDIGTLVDYAKDKGIKVFISTNGWLLPRRIADLRRVNRITISLDGGAEIHDRIRGEGAWTAAVEAIRLCHEEGIPVACTCVLSAENLHTVDALLDAAGELGVGIMFQPATKWLDSSDKPNPLAPEISAYRATIDRLIARKRRGAAINNSIAGLRILRKWPDPTVVRSTAGWITCTVEPDGKLFASHLAAGGELEAPREDDTPPWKQYPQMPVPDMVDQPWCAPILELDLIFGLHPEAIWNTLRVQTGGTKRHD